MPAAAAAAAWPQARHAAFWTKRRTLADQLVAALRARIERRTGNGHDFTACFRGETRGDQGSGLGRSLDDDRARGQARDDPVAIGEMPRPRLGPRRHFRNDQAALEHRLLPRLVLRRVEDVEAPGDHADRAGFQRPVMSRAVDPARKAGDHHRALLAEIVGELARKAAGRRRGVSRSDDRDQRLVQQANVALHRESGGASSSSASVRG